MFDFMDSDWFIISLEIIFLILMWFDVKKYIQTKKKEYLTNIVLTLGFFIWTAIPFYNSYITWDENDKEKIIAKCTQENNETLCKCIKKAMFKEYSYPTYLALTQNNAKELDEYIKDAKEECLDDSWF